VDQRRAVVIVAVVGAVALLLVVALPALRLPDDGDAGVGLLEPLGDLGFGRDARPDEVDAEGCELTEGPLRSPDERIVEVRQGRRCTLTVEATPGGLLALADRDRTLVLRPATPGVTATVHLDEVRATEGLTDEREVRADAEGVRVDLTCSQPSCTVIVGRPPGG
jgi:hypothetical protein